MPEAPFRHPADPVRARNRKKVLDALRREGAAARIELAQRAELSPATVSVITADLLAEGLLREVADNPGNSRRGRPRTLLDLNPDAAYAVGIKISMHQAAVSLTNMVGDVLATATVPVRANQMAPTAIAAICRDRVLEIIARTEIDPGRILGVGVGVPGFVGYPSGEVRWSPIFARRDVPFREMVADAIGLATVIDNDANMAALAEKWFGFGRRHADLLVVTVEHGVGMGLLVDGRLYRGARGYGGEFGHTCVVPGGAPCRCGARGCVEAYVSHYAIVRASGVDCDLDDPVAVQLEIDRLIGLSDGGDLDTEALFRRAGVILGTGIANLCRVLDPPAVVLSGQRTKSAAVFLETVRETLADSPLIEGGAERAIAINPWGDDLWARGAAALVLEEIQV